MKNGFRLTLMIVAVLMMAINVMARAPTIVGIPNTIIVGDVENATGSNNFVFPTALDLGASSTDDDTAASEIVWSYLGSTTTYRINDADPVSDAISAITPGAGEIIGGPGATANDPADDPTGVTGLAHIAARDAGNPAIEVDNDPDTMTVRNADLSALVGGAEDLAAYAASTPDPGALGPSASKVLTLFASDGSTVGMKDVEVYSIHGEDGREGGGEIVVDLDFTTSNHGWTFSGEGNATGAQSASGLCVNTSLAGENLGIWTSEYALGGALELTPNTVYKARMTVATSATSPGTQPIWLFDYENFDFQPPDVFQGENAYGGVHFFIDNEQGANSAIAGVGRSDFEVWFTPGCVLTNNWNNDVGTILSAFNAANDANNDFRLKFRVYDRDSDGLQNNNRSGQLCFSGMTIEAFNINDRQVLSTPYDRTTFPNASGTAPESAAANAGFVYFEDTSAGKQTGVYTITGTAPLNIAISGASGNSGVIIRPGQDNDYAAGFTAVNTDRFPVPWVSDQLLMSTWSLSASGEGAANPSDNLLYGWGSATNELLHVTFLTPNLSQDTAWPKAAGPAMPKTSAEDFVCFLYSHSVTNSSLAGTDNLRPRFDIINTTAAINGHASAEDGMQFHQTTVDVVSFD